MEEVLPSNAKQFLERFQNLYDSVIRTVKISFGQVRDRRATGVSRGVLVVLSAQDQTVAENDGWVNLSLEIEAVTEIVLVEGKTTSVVLSNGLSMGFFDGEIFLAFDAEAESIDEFRTSNFLVVGEKCTWATSSYQESGEQPAV